jgi:hypothetical protein
MNQARWKAHRMRIPPRLLLLSASDLVGFRNRRVSSLPTACSAFGLPRALSS